MLNRYEVYNETLHYIEKEEQAGNLFVIRPEVPLQVDRMEKDTAKLQNLYEQGYEDAKRQFADLQAFCKISTRLWRWSSLQPFYYWFQYRMLVIHAFRLWYNMDESM